MSIVKATVFGIGLIAAALALPAGAAPSKSVPRSYDAGGFCLTPNSYQGQGWFGQTVKAKHWELRTPVYTLNCGPAAWINHGTQAYLEGEIVLTTRQGRTSIFCNQAIYDMKSGGIQLQGSVRVAAYRANSSLPVVSTGDSGVVILKAAPTLPQIVLHTDPPEQQYHIRRRG